MSSELEGGWEGWGKERGEGGKKEGRERKEREEERRMNTK